MGRGSARMTTAWVPWDDVPVEAGGLAVLAGSSSLPGFDRLRRTYAEADVSATDIEASWGGSYTTDPVELSAFDRGARWLTADYRAGDVLLFSMKTLHGAITNTASPTLRLSADVRWQPGADPVDGVTIVSHGPILVADGVAKFQIATPSASGPTTESGWRGPGWTGRGTPRHSTSTAVRHYSRFTDPVALCHPGCEVSIGWDHTGPWRTLNEAKQRWGLPPPPGAAL